MRVDTALRQAFQRLQTGFLLGLARVRVLVKLKIRLRFKGRVLK